MGGRGEVVIPLPRAKEAVAENHGQALEGTRGGGWPRKGGKKKMEEIEDKKRKGGDAH